MKKIDISKSVFNIIIDDIPFETFKEKEWDCVYCFITINRKISDTIGSSDGGELKIGNRLGLAMPMDYKY
jgi:hypothetical protein